MKTCLHQKDKFVLVQSLSSEMRYVLIFECYNMVVTLPRFFFSCFKKLSFHVCDWHWACFVFNFSNQGNLSFYSPSISTAVMGNLKQDRSCCSS